jgi:hypothetical protein
VDKYVFLIPLFDWLGWACCGSTCGGGDYEEAVVCNSTTDTLSVYNA